MALVDVVPLLSFDSCDPSMDTMEALTACMGCIEEYRKLVAAERAKSEDFEAVVRLQKEKIQELECVIQRQAQVHAEMSEVGDSCCHFYAHSNCANG